MILIGSTALIPCLFEGMLRLLCGLISPNEKAAIDMNMVSIHTCSSNCTLCPHSMCNLWRLTHLAPTGVLSTISANMGDPLPNSHRGLDRGDHESLEKPSRLLGLHKIGHRPTALTLFPYFDWKSGAASRLSQRKYSASAGPLAMKHRQHSGLAMNY